MNALPSPVWIGAVLILVFFLALMAHLIGSWLTKRLIFSQTSNALVNLQGVPMEKTIEVEYALNLERLKSTTLESESFKEEISVLKDELNQIQKDFNLVREQKSSLQATLEAEKSNVSMLRSQLEKELLAHAQTKESFNEAHADLAKLSVQIENERSSSTEKIELLNQAREHLSLQFKNLAQEILDEKSKKFSEDNQVRISQLLDPLKLKITEFQSKVESVYVQESKDRSALAEQVKNLISLNHNLTQEAKNLTTALKGSSKTQGNWGELVLERVLEGSGLRKGEEYVVQVAQTREDGSKALADVVIHLPEDRALVVDSKMSLNAYDEFMSTEDTEQKEKAAKKHVDSVKNHIKELSDKNYQDLYGIRSLDFVLMFIPIEPAFMLAITNDKDIFMQAWKKNVLLVSPSTLLFVVRTVAHLWRQEAQSKNAQDIASRGAELYDKLVGFLEDLESLGAKLKQAQSSYDSAFNKLSIGRANVIRQAEMLKTLGVKPSKQLPPATLARMQEASEEEHKPISETVSLSKIEKGDHA